MFDVWRVLYIEVAIFTVNLKVFIKWVCFINGSGRWLLFRYSPFLSLPFSNPDRARDFVQNYFIFICIKRFARLSNVFFHFFFFHFHLDQYRMMQLLARVVCNKKNISEIYLSSKCKYDGFSFHWILSIWSMGNMCNLWLFFSFHFTRFHFIATKSIQSVIVNNILMRIAGERTVSFRKCSVHIENKTYSLFFEIINLISR